MERAVDKSWAGPETAEHSAAIVSHVADETALDQCRSAVSDSNCAALNAGVAREDAIRDVRVGINARDE
jgi:hypothetical protein